MYRLVALLFALLLPLQFAWGAAAAYCQHETTIETSKHFGHHEHVHKADAKKPADSKLVGDNDCSACHATCSAVISEAADGMGAPVTTRRMVFPPAPPHTSVLARAPDRPQWLRLA
jgi:hypothetical protein